MEHLFQELSRTSYFINRVEDTSLAWCNSHLAARTEKGIHLFEFSKNLNCTEKKIDFKENFIETPTGSPCTKLLSNVSFQLELRNRDLAEMVLDSALWPHSAHLSKEMSTVVAFEWSPRGLLQSNECVLAIVNNIGGVELYVSGRTTWISILDLSNLIRNEFKDITKKVASFEDLKQAVYYLESCSVCWSPILREGTSYLVTGQKNGTILFWMIKSADDTTTAKCCGKIEADFGETVTLVWIPKSETHFALICSHSNGQISAFQCQIDEENVVLNNSYMLWDHKDRMLVQHIQYEIIENKLLLVFHKHRHLVMQLINENFKVTSQVIENVNDYQITSIVKSNGHFYISTVNSNFFYLKYVVHDNTLTVKFESIVLKDINEMCELYSVSFSCNNVMCAFSIVDRRVLHKKQPLKVDIILTQVLPDNAELEILLKNPTKNISNYWDCIELLRYRIVKTKTLPLKDYDRLLSVENKDLYLLKIYLIILTVYKTLQVSTKMGRMHLPEESVEAIKDQLFVAHAKSNIIQLYNKQCNGELLSDFVKECFVGSKKFLRLYCDKYKISINDMITQNMLDLKFENCYSYTCQNCDEDIIDFECSNGHRNMFCMLTFTPIESIDYLTCKNCSTIARIELKSLKPMCLICDSIMS